jgi:membrane-associated phospholipid phosphatase
MLADYLPYLVAVIGICLALYAWQRSVRLARSARKEGERLGGSSNNLPDQSHRRTLEPASGQIFFKRDVSRRQLRWIIFAVASMLVLIASFYFDDSVARLVKDQTGPRLRAAGRFVSHYGDWPEHAALGGILWLVAYMRKSRRWQRVVLMMILASVLGGLSADVVRAATGRPRPSTHLADGWYGPHLDYKYNAFPSGHAAASTAFFGVLLFVEWPIGAIALIFPFGVGIARLVVNAHHFSDIIGSAIVGVVAAYAATRILRPRSPQAMNDCAGLPSPSSK